MEASLLISPKPSRTVSLFFSSRVPARRFFVTAGGQGKDLETRSDRRNNCVRQPSRLPGGRSGVFAVAAAAVSGAVLTLPCHATEALPDVQLYRAVAVLGELDPATAKAVAGVAGPALSALGFLFILRIVMSWYPRLPVSKFPYVLAYAPTEPFLAVTRKLIPPLGGVDVTPVVWFGLVSFLNEILVGPQGLLVLLSQQR